MRWLFLHRLYWWLIPRIFRPRRVGGVGYIEVSTYGAAESERIRHALEQAVVVLTAAGSDFIGLVRAEVQLVVAMRGPSGSASGAAVWGRAYVAGFERPDSTNPRGLACRLLWTAVYNRLYRQACEVGLAPDERSIRQACFDEEVRFAKGFVDWPDWLEYLQYDQP